MLAAKFAAPLPSGVDFLSPVLARALEGKTTLFNAPPGYLLTGQIASALHDREIPTLWMRLEPEDRDPGMLLSSFLTAARKIIPGAGEAVLHQMRSQPGPVAGWVPLFNLLGRELQQALPPETAIVLEHVQNLSEYPANLNLLFLHFLPQLSQNSVRILTTHGTIPPQIRSLPVQERTSHDLRLDAPAALSIAKAHRVPLSDRDILRIHALTDGRADIISDLIPVCAQIDPILLHHSVEVSRNMKNLLGRITRDWAMNAGKEQVISNLIALRLGYFELDNRSSLKTDRDNNPPFWIQQLDHGWNRIQCIWTPPLQDTLRANTIIPDNELSLAAEHLIGSGAVEQAIPILLEIGDYNRAAESIASVAPSMIDLGQWETLGVWLKQIPEPALQQWPWLVYAKGEISAARRDTAPARQIFSTATDLFRQARDSAGICQSLLTESIMAFWLGEKAVALNHALGAQAEARGAGLLVQQIYAAWQLGCLYADQQLFGSALVHFQEAQNIARQANDPSMAWLAQEAVELIRQERDLVQQGEQYRQALAAAEQAQLEITLRLQNVLNSPASNLEALLSDRGWSRTPLNLKIQPIKSANPMDDSKIPGLWQILLGALGIRSHDETRSSSEPASPSPNQPESQDDILTPSQASPMSQQNLSDDLPVFPTANPAVIFVPVTGEPVQTASQLTQQEDNEIEAAPSPPPKAGTINAYLLGEFRVIINNQLISGWSSGRGKSVFQYLLTYHHRPRARESLMDIFWQEATPESARNSLNVALHNLRSTLRSSTPLPVILFDDGTYRINPEFNLRLDLDEFEEQAQAGADAERAGDFPKAALACAKAIQLYQDDFLSDDPYEEWTVLPRERLRIAFMDALDRLSRIYLKQEHYSASSQLCVRILERDRCREDAHCRLMRCYARQGEYHLALRQYQTCVGALREDLNIEPSQSTIQLYERIRSRETV